MDGQIWASDAMRSAVGELQELGVEWVQIHPYAYVRRDGTVRYRSDDAGRWTDEGIAHIQRGGLKPMLKPHLGYWGTFSWRGAITFGSDEEWARFFQTYEAFIVDQARRAERGGVTVFAVGTELERTVGHEAEWRRIIARVRDVYSGYIVYAANWDGLERVPFWDAVDGIGVQAYFPLGPPDATDADIKTGWAKVLTSLNTLAQRTQKPVLFTEIGYAKSRDAAAEPWKPAVDGSSAAVELRARLTRLALQELPKYEFLVGAFWWKWIPGLNWFQRDFSMRDPEMKRLLGEYWRKGA
jgi:hypothetical protein